MGCYSPESFITRDHSGYGLSQWETTLHCNVASYWLCPYSEWSLMTRFSVSIHISEMASQINCLLNSLLGPAIKKTSTTGVAGSCDGNLRVTGGFPEKIGSCSHVMTSGTPYTLQWRQNEHDGVSNHQRLYCLLISVCSGPDQRKHQSSASLSFVRGIHR